MDAIDVVLTEFDGDKIKDICSLSIPYSLEEKREIDNLRQRIVKQQLTADELIEDNDFLYVHNKYVNGVANAVNELCRQNNIAKSAVFGKNQWNAAVYNANGISAAIGKFNGYSGYKRFSFGFADEWF